MRRTTPLGLSFCLSLAVAAPNCADDANSESETNATGENPSTPTTTTGTPSTDSSTGTQGDHETSLGTTDSTGDAGSAGTTSESGTGDETSLPTCESRARGFQSVIETAYELETEANGGVALAVATPDCAVWSGAAGLSTPEQPLTPGHRYRVGSVTKTHIATAFLQFSEEGRISLDDRLADFVSGVPHGQEITIRQLLNHQSGVYGFMNDEAFMAEVFAMPERALAPQDLIDVALRHEPRFEPGQGWAYSNTNYILLGMILEQLEPGSLGTIIRNRVLLPHQLEETWLDGEEPFTGTLAEGWSEFEGQRIAVTHIQHPSVTWAAGGMVATTADTATWARALYGGRVLSNKAFAEMTTGVDAEFDGMPGIKYGLGVMIFDFDGLGTAYGHMGGIPGYVTMMIYFELLDSALAVVVNDDGREQGLGYTLSAATDVLLDGVGRAPDLELRSAIGQAINPFVGAM